MGRQVWAGVSLVESQASLQIMNSHLGQLIGCPPSLQAQPHRVPNSGSAITARIRAAECTRNRQFEPWDGPLATRRLDSCASQGLLQALMVATGCGQDLRSLGGSARSDQIRYCDLKGRDYLYGAWWEEQGRDTLPELSGSSRWLPQCLHGIQPCPPARHTLPPHIYL